MKRKTDRFEKLQSETLSIFHTPLKNCASLSLFCALLRSALVTYKNSFFFYLYDYNLNFVITPLDSERSECVGFSLIFSIVCVLCFFSVQIKSDRGEKMKIVEKFH